MNRAYQEKARCSRLWRVVPRVLLQAIFPPRCLRCGRFLDTAPGGPGDERPGACGGAVPPTQCSSGNELGGIFRIAMAAHLCECCSAGFRPAVSPMCPQCGLPLPRGADGGAPVLEEPRSGGTGTEKDLHAATWGAGLEGARQKGDRPLAANSADRLCQECLQGERAYRRARAAGIYTPPLSSVIHVYKYGGKLQLASPLSRLLQPVFEREWLEHTVDLLIPVPLDARRMRHRGFHQVIVLVQQWRKAARQDGNVCPPQMCDALVRRRRTRPQTGLKGDERRMNLEGVFAVRQPAKIAGRRLLLVDDVMTTGATAQACAAALMEAGAASVDVLVVARTP